MTIICMYCIIQMRGSYKYSKIMAGILEINESLYLAVVFDEFTFHSIYRAHLKCIYMCLEIS